MEVKAYNEKEKKRKKKLDRIKDHLKRYKRLKDEIDDK